MNSKYMKKSVISLSIIALIVSSQMQLAFAGFEVIQDGAEPKPSSPLKVITEAQGNATLNVELNRLKSELGNVKAELDHSRADAIDMKQALASANAKLDQIQIKIEKLTITFAFGKAEFNPQPEVMDKLVASASQTRQVDVSGFTDNLGTLAANQRVAMNRALAAKQYLVMKGVSETKIKVYGRSGQYIASNKTEAGRAANRRVEIVFSQ